MSLCFDLCLFVFHLRRFCGQLIGLVDFLHKKRGYASSANPLSNIPGLLFDKALTSHFFWLLDA